MAFSNENDVVLDPFIGAGTSAIAAIKAGRKIVGIDRSEEYINLTHERVKALRAGKLELRRSGREVRRPVKGERVSSISEEWSEAAE